MELRVGTDSYVTLEEANDYVKSYYLSNSAEYISWFNSEVSDDDRRAALRQSALSLNNLKYTGRKKLRGQSLAFPRVKPNYGGCGVINTLFISQTHDNSLVDSGSGGDTGLEVARYAQIENAIAYISMNKSLVVKTRERRISGLSSKKAGSVSETYNTATRNIEDIESGIYTKKVEMILRAWITESVYAI